MEKYRNVREIIHEYHLQKHCYNNVRRDLYTNFPLFSFTYDEIIKYTDLAEWKEIEATTEFLDDVFKDAENNIYGQHSRKVGPRTEDHLRETEPPASRSYDTQIDIDRDRQVARREMLDDVDFSDNEDDDLIKEFREILRSETEINDNILPVSPLKMPIERKYRQRHISKLKPLEKVKDYSLLEYQPCIKYSILDAFNVLLDATTRAPEMESNLGVVRSPGVTDDHIKHPDVPHSIQQEPKSDSSIPLDTVNLHQNMPAVFGTSIHRDNIMPYISSVSIQPFENISEPQSSTLPPVMHNIDIPILEANLPTDIITIPEENFQINQLVQTPKNIDIPILEANLPTDIITIPEENFQINQLVQTPKNIDIPILEANLPTDIITIPEENFQINQIVRRPKNWKEVLRNMKRLMYHNADGPTPRKKRRKAIIVNETLNEPNILQNGEPISNVGQIIDEYISNMSNIQSGEAPITNVLQTMEQCLVESPNIEEQQSTAIINNEDTDLFEQQFEMWKKYIADMDSSGIINEYPHYEINLKEFITMGKELCEILKNVLQQDSVNIDKLLSRNLRKATAVKRIKALLELKTRAILSFETTGTNITHVKFDDFMES